MPAPSLPQVAEDLQLSAEALEQHLETVTEGFGLSVLAEALAQQVAMAQMNRPSDDFEAL